MSLQLPICDYCKYYFDDSKVEAMCCSAFPNGIPVEKIRLEDDGGECANGIKFEETVDSDNR